MTVTVQYAAEHLEELAAAAVQGDAVCITRQDGQMLDLTARTTMPAQPAIDPAYIDEHGFRKLGMLKAPITLAEFEEIERDWDENIVPNLWMNRDDPE